MLDLSIIIVNWNVKDLLKKCLESVYRETRGISFEVFVVDNASYDGSTEMVRQEFPTIKLIANEKNLGFARANNQGIKKSQGRYILLLNPDTEILDNALAKMVTFMDKRQDCGVSGCHLFESDGVSHQDSVRRFPSLFDQLIILFKLHHISPRILKNYLARDFDYTKTLEADQVMGAFFMIRRDVLEKIDILDEKFYIWFEEVDFCKRTKEAGYKVCYNPDAKIIHYFGQSFKQVLSFKRQLIFNKSLRRYFAKHSNFIEYIIVSLVSWATLPLSLAYQYASYPFRRRTKTG